MEQLHLLRGGNSPNVIIMRLGFEGEIQRELFEKAIELAGTRHDLLRATLTGDKSNARWVEPPSPVKVKWIDAKFDLDSYSTIPVTANDHVSHEVFVYGNSIEFISQYHHAKADGLGGLQATSDALIVYNNLVNKLPFDTNLRKAKPELILSRDKIGLFQKGWLKRLPVQWIPVYGAIKFGLARISHLMPGKKKRFTRDQ